MSVLTVEYSPIDVVAQSTDAQCKPSKWRSLAVVWRGCLRDLRFWGISESFLSTDVPDEELCT